MLLPLAPKRRNLVSPSPPGCYAPPGHQKSLKPRNTLITYAEQPPNRGTVECPMVGRYVRAPRWPSTLSIQQARAHSAGVRQLERPKAKRGWASPGPVSHAQHSVVLSGRTGHKARAARETPLTDTPIRKASEVGKARGRHLLMSRTPPGPALLQVQAVSRADTKRCALTPNPDRKNSQNRIRYPWPAGTRARGGPGQRAGWAPGWAARNVQAACPEAWRSTTM